MIKGWNKIQLKDFAIINPTISLKKGETYPTIYMKDLNPSFRWVEPGDNKKLKSSGTKFQKNDILFARITPCLENGKIAQVKNLKDKYGFGSTEFFVFRAIEGISDSSFLYYLLLTRKIRKIAEKSMLGTSGRQRAQKSVIEDIEITVPDLINQKTIGSILTILDKKIELNQKTNTILDKMAKSIYRSWFIAFDTFKYQKFKDSDLGEIPKTWSTGKLKDIINIFDSERIPLSRRVREERKGKYPYYGATSIMDYVNDYIFDGIYLLISEDGTVVDKENYPILQYIEGKIWVNNHAHVLQGKEPFFTEYIYLLLSQTNVYPYVTGAVQPKINQTNLKRIPIVIPDTEILLKFKQLISPIFEKIRNNIKESKYLNKIMDLLLPHLFSGKIDIDNLQKFLDMIEIDS